MKNPINLHSKGILYICFALAVTFGCTPTTPITKAPPPIDLAEQYMSKAHEFEKDGDLINALEQYRLALIIDPRNPEANEEKNKLQTVLNERVEKHYQQGLSFYQKGEYNRARQEFLTVLRYNPDHPEALKSLKEQKFETQEVKGYLSHKIQPDETVSILAKKYYGDSRKFQLIAEYNQMEDATKIRPSQEIRIPIMEDTPFFISPEEHITIAEVIPESELTEVNIVKRIVVHMVKSNESLSKLARHYYGDYTNFALLAQFNQLAEDASLKVGQEIRIPEIDGMPFLVKTEEVDIAQEKGPTPVDEDPATVTEEAPQQIAAIDQTGEYRALGLTLFEEKKFADAIIAFKEALQRKPDDLASLEFLSASHFQQGLIFFGKEDYLTARNEFRESLQYNEKCEKCEEYVQKSEEMYMDLHYKKGLIHFRDEELEEAVEDWELIYDMDPEYKDVANNLKKVRLLIERLENIKRSKTEEDK